MSFKNMIFFLIEKRQKNFLCVFDSIISVLKMMHKLHETEKTKRYKKIKKKIDTERETNVC